MRPNPILRSLLLLILVLATPSVAEEVRIVRDDWGIPHIFAKTDEGASYGLGYAQAEDRLEELLKNYRRSEGTMSEAFGAGKDFYRDDVRQRMWKHREVSEARYGTLPEKSRRCIEAFQAGIKAFMAEHPEQVPDWGPELHPWQVLALSRFIIWGWPEGDAAEDLSRAGIQPDPIEYHGSNEWLITPSRTADGHVLALIDPHLSWYGPFRFYECRMYGETIKVSGACIVGLPLPTLGHSEYCSVAMTTGAGDTADVFEEKLNPDNPLQYEVDGDWWDLKVRKTVVRVKKEDGTIDEMEVEIHESHRGPIVARKDGKAYAFAIPYMEDIGLCQQSYEMMTAKNVDEMTKALSHVSLMGQNIMVGTVDGDIYYVRTGKVPIRPEGVDPLKPIPGHISKNDWLGIYPPEDFVQVLNPPHGYMQNCNVSPNVMMKDSPMKLEDYPPPLYGVPLWPLHQRAAQVVEILHTDDSVTVEEAIDLALNMRVWNSDKWQARLAKALETAPDVSAGAMALAGLIADWNNLSKPDSVGAVAYYYWKKSLPQTDEQKMTDRMGNPPQDSLTDAVLIAALEDGAKGILADHGKLEVAYGDKFRVGREGGQRSWPVGGGNPGFGMATPRAANFGPAENHQFLGRGGQTSVQVVQLTKPPKSWTLLPLGQSDHTDSGHWDDQAEELFGPGLMKPTYFMDEEGLREHTESVTVLFPQVPE